MTVRSILNTKGHQIMSVEPDAKLAGAVKLLGEKKIGAVLVMSQTRLEGILSFNRADAETAAKVPAMPLSRALRDGRVLGFLAVWFGVNIIFGVGSIGVDSETTSVAWQAHIGGFFAGLLLFALFDPVPRVRNDDAADASSQDVSDRI